MSDADRVDAPVPRSLRFASLYRMLALDVVLPLVVVQVGLHAGLTPLVALTIATVFPLADVAIGVLQSRSVSIIAAVSLTAIWVGIGFSLVTGNARFAILKDSAFTFVFSLLFLGSLATARPLIFRLNRQMVTPDVATAFDRAWVERPAVRRTFRLMTIVWGVGLLAEALVRVAVTFTLPVALAAVLSQWLAFVFIGGLIAWTVLYARSVRKAAARIGL